MDRIDSTVACIALGIPPHQMRQWRAAGYLDGIGRRERKTYSHTAVEFGQLALGNFVRSHGFSLRRAFAIAHAHAAQIRGALSLATAEDTVVRVPLTLDRPYGPFDERGADEDEAVGVLVINLAELCRRALERVNAARAAA